MGKKLKPVLMKNFFAAVTDRINRATGQNYTNIQYVVDVCRGTKKNSVIDGVKKKCIEDEIAFLKELGMKPRYPV